MPHTPRHSSPDRSPGIFWDLDQVRPLVLTTAHQARPPQLPEA
jgi:hypothetical protein